MKTERVQGRIGRAVASELSTIIGSEVGLEKVNIGLFNRILVNGLSVKDKEGKEILKVNRLSASFDILPLLQKKIRINTVQLFGFNFVLEKENKDAQLNIQYILDAFASKEKKEKSALDLRVNYVLLRNGSFNYDVLSEDTLGKGLDLSHINIENISANISLKKFNPDSINLNIKRLAFKETNGFEMKKMSLRFRSNREKLILDNLKISLGKSELAIDSVWLTDRKGNIMKLELVAPEYGIAINRSNVNLGDLSYFVSPLEGVDKDVRLDLSATGNRETLWLNRLSMASGGDFNFNMTSVIDTAGVNIPSFNVYIGNGMVAAVPAMRRMIDSGTLGNIGYVRIQSTVGGPYSKIKASTKFSSPIGELYNDLYFSLSDRTFSLIGTKVKSKQFRLDKLLPKSGLGEAAFNLAVKTRHLNRDFRMSQMYVKGEVSRLDYQGYTYDNILIDGGIDRGIYKGRVELDDENGYLMVNGTFNNRRYEPEINIKAEVKNARLFETGLVKNPKYENSVLSFSLDANSSGNDIDNFKGYIEFDSLNFIGSEGTYSNSKIRGGVENIGKNERRMYLDSDFLKAELRGDYNYKYFVNSVVSLVNKYMPVVEVKKNRKNRRIKKNSNNFSFEIELDNTDFFRKVLMLPVELNKKANVNGYFNEELNRFALNAFVPELKYENKYIESSSLVCKTLNEDSVSVVCRTNIMMKNYSMLGVSLYSTIYDNNISTELFWGNDQKETYGGNINLHTLLEKKDKRIKTSLSLDKSEFILKDSLWNIHPAEIVIDSGKVDISNLRIDHMHQFIDVNGIVSEDVNDSLFVKLNDIDLRYIFELADIRKVVDLSGQVSGNAYGNGVLQEPRINADLYVDNFSLNSSRLGDMKLKGVWDSSDKGIHLDGDMRDGDISHTKVDGVIYPIKPGSIDLRVVTSHVDLGFLRQYMASISSDINGRASGDIRIHGPFSGINLTGNAVAEDFKFKVDILNTYLCTSDSVHFEYNRILMDDILVTDGLGNRARATVSLPHNHLKDLRFNVRANLENMLVLNTKDTPDLPFYGKVFASGFLNLNGGPGNLTVNADVQTELNSNFVFELSSTSTATNSQFVTFVDKTKYWRTDTLYVPESRKKKVEGPNLKMDSDIRLNLNIDVNPNAYLKLIMDPASGDYIGGNGNGNIKVDFYNKGDVKIYGNYTINQGVYKFSLQEIIRKDFIIKSGSSIVFNGNPLDADLDINAIYTVNSVPLQDLGADVASQAGQTNVKVNCTMNLSGDLTKPEIKLGLELPNEGEEVERTVLNAISTDEQMNIQILYLLGIGKFYMQDYTGETQNSNALSSVLSSTISGQLNNIFSNLINSNNLNIGTNLSTGVNGWTDMEFEGMLSGQLLNNRLLINGNFGYRDNALSQSNFIGDFEVEYLLTKNGNFRVKAYTKTNDRYYTKTTLTTQGLGFVFKRDFNNWRDFFGIENPDKASKRKNRKDSKENNIAE